MATTRALAIGRCNYSIHVHNLLPLQSVVRDLPDHNRMWFQGARPAAGLPRTASRIDIDATWCPPRFDDEILPGFH